MYFNACEFLVKKKDKLHKTYWGNVYLQNLSPDFRNYKVFLWLTVKFYFNREYIITNLLLL